MDHSGTICSPSNARLVDEAKASFRSSRRYNPRLEIQLPDHKTKEGDYAGLVIESMMDNWNPQFPFKPAESDRDTVVSDDSEPEMEINRDAIQQMETNLKYQDGEDSDSSSEHSPHSPIEYLPSTGWIKLNGEIDRSLLKDSKTWFGMRPMADIFVGPNHIPDDLDLNEVQNLWPFNQMWTISIPPCGLADASPCGLAITVHPTACWYFLRKLYSQQLPTDEMELRSVLAMAKYIAFTAEAALKALYEAGVGPYGDILVPFRDWISTKSADPLNFLDVDQMAGDNPDSLMKDPNNCRFLVLQDHLEALWALSQAMKRQIASLIDFLEIDPQPRSPTSFPQNTLFQRMFSDSYA